VGDFISTNVYLNVFRCTVSGTVLSSFEVLLYFTFFFISFSFQYGDNIIETKKAIFDLILINFLKKQQQILKILAEVRSFHFEIKNKLF